MSTYEIRLQVESHSEPSKTAVLRVLEKHMDSPPVKVLNITETVTCALCGEPAQVTTHYDADRKRWWEFWRSHYDLPKYHFSTQHPCMRIAAADFAKPGDPWYQVALEEKQHQIGATS